MVYCSECGMENNSKETFCKSCGSALIKEEYFKINKYDEFDKLLTKKNKEELAKHSFTVEAYYSILTNILNQGSYRLNQILASIPPESRESMSIINKIGFITLAFTDVNYKSKGAELGYYAFNLINVDDRLNTAEQIGTLIHELAHHLVSEIFEQAMMFILETEKSEEIEAMAWFALSAPSAVLMNEYCAHSVEGRFVPHGYQNFGSFNNVLNSNFDPQKEEDKQLVHSQIVLGNSLAEDILRILEFFITPEMREEIKNQYNADFNYPPKYDQIGWETKEVLPETVKPSLINFILDVAFLPDADEGYRAILEDLKENFAIFYKAKGGSL